MAVEIAAKNIGRRIDVLRKEIASLRNVESVNLSEILKVNPDSEYPAWVDGAKKARRFFANRKERKDARAGIKIVQLIISEFKTSTRWRGLMNRLAADQVSDQIHSIRNLADQKSMVKAIRKMAIAQAKIAGSPDAEELIDYLIKEQGILQDEAIQKASADESVRIGKLKAQQAVEEKEAQQRKEQVKKTKTEAEKAEEELEEIQLIKYEENRKAQQRKLEAERVKEVLARQRIFQPGTWKFRTCVQNSSQDQSSVHEMSISFTSGGLFSTEYKSNSKGVRTASEISGTWDYDYVQQILNLNGTHKVKHIPGGLMHRLMSLLKNEEVLTNAYDSRFTITGSPDGLLEAYDNNGVQWQIIRTSRPALSK